MDKPLPNAGGFRPTRRAVLTASAVAAAAAATATPILIGSAGAATVTSDAGPGFPTLPQLPSAALRALVRQIDPDRMRATVERLVAFGTRHTLSVQDDPVRGIGAARDWIYDQLLGYAAASGGRMTVEKQSFVQPVSPRVPVPTVITNVIATLRGVSAPERVYVVTGHYDSRVTDVMNFTSDAPGADDDGSGVAVVLELARVLASQPTEATIVLAAVAGEEQGLYGSDFMAKTMKGANVDVQAMFSNDIVGASQAWDGTKPDPQTLRLFTEGVPTSETAAQANTRRAVGGEVDGPSRQLGRFVTDVASFDLTGMHVRTIYRRDRYLRASDHVSFLTQAYPAARFTEPRENFNHEHQDVRIENGIQFGDLTEFCDFDYMARVAKVNLAVMWSLAQGPGTPRNARLLTAALTNESTLTWLRGTEADLAGYEVLWRETTDPDWTHVIPVGDVTSVTIDLSKDNVFFGIRAVDADGMRSQVAFPQPG